MQRTETVSWLMGTVQRALLPHREAGLAAPLTEQEKRLINILARVRRENAVPKSASRQWLGRPMQEREAIARSCVAKAVWGSPHTRAVRHAWRTTATLRTLCGCATRSAVPSAAPFARACAALATRGRATVVPAALVHEPLSTAWIGHVRRDATASQGREKPVKKVTPPKPPRQTGRPAQGVQPEATDPQRLEGQRRQSAQDASALLPTAGDRGVKKTAPGDTDTWNGLTLHVDVQDTGLSLSALVTSASMQESQAAIPLRQLTSGKVTSGSARMEAADGAQQIWEQSRALGQVPSMDRHPRGGTVVPLAPPAAQRSNERTASERCNSRLKEAFGGRNGMVRGAEKVMLPLRCGVVALCADPWRNVTGSNSTSQDFCKRLYNYNTSN